MMSFSTLCRLSRVAASWSEVPNALRRGRVRRSDRHVPLCPQPPAFGVHADDVLPEDPEGLLPAVRRVRFDPPQRPGETSLIEIEDYVTSQAVEQTARSLEDSLRALVWLRASRRRS